MADIDVLMVCQHNAEMVREAIRTAKLDEFVNIYLWDNGGLFASIGEAGAFVFWGSETNAGFILPNNLLAPYASAPYICLLNADTISSAGWTKPLLAALESGKGDIVGYRGGLLNEQGLGVEAVDTDGAECDYIEGWCMMMRRSTWEALGGFDEQNLSIGYAEDSDLCLRAKEQGLKLYVCGNLRPIGGLRVEHLGGQGKSPDMAKSPELYHAFQSNHAYVRSRHAEYLKSGRVLAKDRTTIPVKIGRAV